MDCINPPSYESKRSKFSKTFSKCINPQTPSRFAPTQPKLRTLSEELNISIKSIRSQPKLSRQKSHHNKSKSFDHDDTQIRHYKTDHVQVRSSPETCYKTNSVQVRSSHNKHFKTDRVQVRSEKSYSGEILREEKFSTKEALVAKLFASISSIKASYAELQSAQFPYNGEAIQSADEDLVSELIILSELKQKYISKKLDLPPPHVTQLLAEIQEQQSNIKTYEISMKQMEWKIEQKDVQITSLTRKFEDITKGNRSLEKRLYSSGVIFPLRNNITRSELNYLHFIRVLHYTLRSLRQFVKHLVGEMVSKNWDIDLAAKAIQPYTVFTKSTHKIYAFESYVTQIMFDGFNHHNFFLPDDSFTKQGLNNFFESFMELQRMTTVQIFAKYPKCPFARFCKSKYLKIVHPKMECSIFGCLDQRKIISSGAFPETEFFSLFAEMAKRVWLLHCLAFCFETPAAAFQVKRGCRFSEVYMESVTKESDGVANDVEFMVAFTVVPGFKIGKTVVQSQVYISQFKK